MSLGAETVCLLREWQTLVAGVLAIVAAMVGGLFVLWQTGQAKRQFADMQRRQLRAARAVLPIAASIVTDYAERCMAVSLAFRSDGEKSLRVAREVPPIPAETVPQLQQLIERLDEAESQGATNLLRAIQIQSDRLRGFARNIGDLSLINPHDGARERLIEAAVIAALSARLYSYGRGIDERIETGRLIRSEVSTPLTTFRVDGVTDEKTLAILAALYPEKRETTPHRWLWWRAATPHPWNGRFL